MVESDVNGLTTTYTYYPDGLRKTKTVGEETTQYYYDGDVVVNETLNGQWSATNIKALGNRIVKRTTEDGENALMYNSRGDVVMILAWEDSAEPVAAYLYLAYGKLYSDLSDFYGTATLYDPYVFDCPIMYSGQYYDHETGLYYLRARYYSPDLCRLISEDPIKDGLNWYAYCAGNPVMFADPSGKSLIGTLLLLLLAGGAAMLAGCSSTTVYDDTPPITINPPEEGFVFAPPIEVHIPDIEPVIEVIPVTMTSVLYGGNSSYGKLTCGFDGYKTIPGRHEGIDFSVGWGVPIYSLINGEVIGISTTKDGVTVLAIYDNVADKTVFYLHGDYTVNVGDILTVGTQIGTESNKGTDKESNYHTHIEVRNGKRTDAASSRNNTLSNEDPETYWNSKGYSIG